MKQIYTMVGMKFRGTEAIVAAMMAGESLTLQREPNNAHDPNAVAVYSGELHVAYVKGTEARALALQMDGAGQKSIPGIFAVSADRWPMVEVDSR